MNWRKLLRIARWEFTKNAGGLDRRTLAVAGVAILLIGLVAPLVATGGIGLDDGLYRVAVDEDSPYHDVVAADDTFATVERADSRDLQAGDVDLLIRGHQIEHAPTAKGLAAQDELRESVRAHNERHLRAEANWTAAYPVSVTIEYLPQTGVDTAFRVEDGVDAGDEFTPDEQPHPDDRPDDDDSLDAIDGEGDIDTDGEDKSVAEEAVSTPSIDTERTGGLGGFGARLTGEDTVTGAPGDIDPPFPFQSLVLAFIVVIPLNFLIQAYGSTMLAERINRRGELLLVSPVTRVDIVGGKTLPYFLGALAIEAVILVGMFWLVRGELGGLQSLLAVVPLILLFLGATFLGAMFARSYKELTFVTVTITVALTSYAFVPAIFTDVGAIALISPLTLVVRELQGEAVTALEFTFSTLTPTLAAVVLFALGLGLYREEDMFDQRPIPGKVLDALAGPISRPLHVGIVTAVLIPFVFLVELLAIATLFALGELSIVLILVVVAVVEEVAKSLHVYAAYEHDRFERSLPVALLLGAISGLAFFLAEKIAVIAQLVGLPELQIGEAALQGAVPTGPVLLLFLLAPLALHVLTAAISALGASRGKRPYLLALSLAILVHFAYNWTVVMTLV